MPIDLVHKAGASLWTIDEVILWKNISNGVPSVLTPSAILLQHVSRGMVFCPLWRNKWSEILTKKNAQGIHSTPVGPTQLSIEGLGCARDNSFVVISSPHYPQKWVYLHFTDEIYVRNCLEAAQGHIPTRWQMWIQNSTPQHRVPFSLCQRCCVSWPGLQPHAAGFELPR